MSLKFKFLDKQWFISNVDWDNPVTVYMYREGTKYDEEYDKQTIYYDKDTKKFYAVDDWGGDASFNSWDELFTFLNKFGPVMEVMIGH